MGRPTTRHQLTRITRIATAATACLAASAVLALPAVAENAAPATHGGVSLTHIDSSRFPIVRVGFAADDVRGKRPPIAFFENDRRISGESLYNGPIGDYQDLRRTDIMLVLDTSLSMGTGTRIQDAVTAARHLIDRTRGEDRIGLATFGGTARVLVHPTDDHGRVLDALDDIELANRTTMFDAVSMAARAFDGTAGEANRAIVLLSDGTDAGSAETLDEAIGEGIKEYAPVYAIAIREDGKQPIDLEQLGNGTHGELTTVTDSAQLDGVFDELGRRLLQRYWIEYRSTAPARSSVNFGIAVNSRSASDIVARRTFSAVASANALGGSGASALPHAKLAEPTLPIPGGLTGVLLAALPFGLLLFWVSWTYLQRRSTPDVLRRVERYTARATVASLEARDAVRESLLVRLARPFVRISETMLGTTAFFGKIRSRAEQASIAIKPSELFTAMLASGTGGGFLALVFGAPFVLTILFGFFAFCVPNLWLILKARKRRRHFEDQLADVLQGIASSLQAGHSFNQAINAMIKDAPSPTAEEFSRVMTETRLGMPIEVALQNMAERMGSADFDFAVTTVNIQRTVGGSLADILMMVGDTVRNRQQFRKKVKALTSMGQMSAYVLLAMPVFIMGVITLMSPMYTRPLFFTTPGHFMLAAGAMSMFLGYLTCMKIVRVKV